MNELRRLMDGFQNQIEAQKSSKYMWFLTCVHQNSNIENEFASASVFPYLWEKNKYWYVRNYLITLDCALWWHTNSLSLIYWNLTFCRVGLNLRIRNTLSYLNKRRDVRSKKAENSSNDFIRALDKYHRQLIDGKTCVPLKVYMLIHIHTHTHTLAEQGTQ